MGTKGIILLVAALLVGTGGARGQCDMMGSGSHKHGTSESTNQNDQHTQTQAADSKAYASINEEGIQQATIIIKDGYHPDTLVVKKSIPLRLNFDLQEESCTGTVVFKDFHIKRKLSSDAVTAVEFTPDKAGSFTFSCPMGMITGTLVVKE